MKTAEAAMKTALDIIQLWFSYFHGILAYTLPGILSRNAAVVGSFTPVSLYVYGDRRVANLSVPL